MWAKIGFWGLKNNCWVCGNFGCRGRFDSSFGFDPASEDRQLDCGTYRIISANFLAVIQNPAKISVYLTAIQESMYVSEIV